MRPVWLQPNIEAYQAGEHIYNDYVEVAAGEPMYCLLLSLQDAVLWREGGRH